MDRRESVELTVLCLLTQGEKLLLQHRKKKDWPGLTLPGGHVEHGESVVDAVIREMKEETGLTVHNPRLCGLKQFPIDGGRYLVFLFSADSFDGELVSSEEGEMGWYTRQQLQTEPVVEDFWELLRVFEEQSLSEFQYVIQDGRWLINLR